MMEVRDDRRLVLRNAAQLLAGLCVPGLGLTGLAGCASGPKAPRPPTVPLSKVGVLTVGQNLTASGDATPFFGVSMAQITFNPIAMAVAAVRAPFVNAVASVRFNAQEAIYKRLMPALLAAGLPVMALEDYQMAADVRNYLYKGVPAEFDALLDVQVTAAGYYPASNAGGYSPMMYVVAKLLMTNKPGEEFASFNYDADYRPAQGDSRFFTTPKEISADKPEAIVQKAELIRTEMDNIAARMVERMVIDIGRRIRNEAPLP
jgi:hypothetical protein